MAWDWGRRSAKGEAKRTAGTRLQETGTPREVAKPSRADLAAGRRERSWTHERRTETRERGRGVTDSTGRGDRRVSLAAGMDRTSKG